MDSVLSVLINFKFCEEDHVNDRLSTIILTISRRPDKIHEGEPSGELNFCPQLTIHLFITKEYGPRLIGSLSERSLGIASKFLRASCSYIKCRSKSFERRPRIMCGFGLPFLHEQSSDSTSLGINNKCWHFQICRELNYFVLFSARGS